MQEHETLLQRLRTEPGFLGTMLRSRARQKIKRLKDHANLFAAQPGSRIVTTNCRTYGDLEAARQSSAKFMDEHTVAPCTATPCTGH